MVIVKESKATCNQDGLLGMNQGAMYSVGQILRSSQLPTLDSQILLGHVLGFSKVELVTRDQYELTMVQYQSYARLYNDCLAGMPIAYILGYREFYSRKFKVSAATLIPRPETELLVEAVLGLAKDGNKILDLGTGSGCIAISLKLENPTLMVTATDKYAQTLDIARSNADNLGAEIKFIQSDWFSAISGEYDIIVSNPPYIATNDQHMGALLFEPQAALTDGADGLGAIRQIITDSRQYLRGGYLLLEHGYNQGVATMNLMLKHEFKDVTTTQDYANLDRITIGRAN